MAEIQGTQFTAGIEQTNFFGKATRVMGGVVSLALIAGVGVWGYKLLVRDVSGVPVVRAAEGPMRVQPNDPGGRQAQYQGLSVNDVAADGVAAAPADRLILAPQPLKLTLEDEPATPISTQPTAADVAAGKSNDSVTLASVEQVIAGADNLSDRAPVTKAMPQAVELPRENTKRATEGLGRSLRPHLRPANLKVASLNMPAATASGVMEADPDSIPVGTRLAQLGAFESAEIARKEWERLSAGFGEFLEGKTRVIQKAQSGGRTFYRLRAMGFADLSDARRFCSALVAEKAECIPVVTR